MNYLEWMQDVVKHDYTRILLLECLILVANMLDFSIGIVNAKFNPKIAFSSKKAKYGLAEKMVLFILCIIFVPIAQLVPYAIGNSALHLFLLGYLATEIYSILGHLDLASDDSKTHLFMDFFKNYL